jgi:hypothetical protein
MLMTILNPTLERRREQEQLRLLYALQDLRPDRSDAVDEGLLGRTPSDKPIKDVAMPVVYEMPKRRLASEN